jgi:hypothetical protein
MDLNKSLEILENDIWQEPDYDNHLVTICHKLRKKVLSDFDIENLRIMIGQNIGLKFLIPIAIKKIQNNILAEGDFYEGDLLKSILESDPDFWKSNRENWSIVCSAFEEQKDKLDYNNSDLFKAFKFFNQIHD